MSRKDMSVNGNAPPKLMKTFLQPLTVALVMVIFVSLILIMGIMDLARLDRTLVNFMENRGLDIITTIENVAQENLTYLRRASNPGGLGSATFEPVRKKAFLPQETLIKSLVDLGREIDRKWKADHLSQEDLKAIAARENLWLVAFFNRAGTLTFQNTDFLSALPPEARTGIARPEDITLDFVNRFFEQNKVGHIALRRIDGSGTIVIALDEKGRRYWNIRIAVEKALEEVGWGQGLTYLVVMDNDGKIFGETGDVPGEFKVVDDLAGEVLTKKLPKASRTIMLKGRGILEIIVPVSLDEDVVGFARLGLDRGKSDIILKENRNRMIISMIFIMAIGILSMWALYRNQKRNIVRIETMERQLQQAERLSALGQFAAGVAHEIRNPLNAISMASQRIQREYMPDDEDRRRKFYHITGIIRDEIRRLNGIIEEFLTFFKSRRLELSEHSVAFVVQKVINLMEDETRSKGIEIKTTWNDDNAMVTMDLDKMQQALVNIFKNAMESIEGQGVISVIVESGSRDRVSIKITDTGSGLTKDELDRIFNPEFTTKEKGLGLGLPLAHEIIKGHRGEIRVTSRVHKGTTVEILLPMERG
jgi:signal transduction histidine kinase